MSTRLYILRPVEDLPSRDNPWEPWYDKRFGFVVRAQSEEDARKIAHDRAGDENRGEFMGSKIANTAAPWLESRYSSCLELLPDGEIGLIIYDEARA
jgi:hypothetical protein